MAQPIPLYDATEADSFVHSGNNQVLRKLFNAGITAENLSTSLALPVTYLDSSAWTTYTPGLTATTTSPTLGTSPTQAGSWAKQARRTVAANVRIVFGTGAPTAGTGNYQVGLPTPRSANAANYILGHGFILDSSAAAYFLVTAYQDADTSKCLLIAETVSIVTNASPFTWAASDEINLSLLYESST